MPNLEKTFSSIHEKLKQHEYKLQLQTQNVIDIGDDLTKLRTRMVEHTKEFVSY